MVIREGIRIYAKSWRLGGGEREASEEAKVARAGLSGRG